jgi:hypothetical protein
VPKSPGFSGTSGRGALRLWFAFDGVDVRLTQVTRLAKRPPPSLRVGDGQPIEKASGAWVEVRDNSGRCLWRHLLHDPFDTVVEAPAEGGGHTNAYREKPSGILVLLVPDLPAGATVALVSSPLEFRRRHEAARDVAEFDIRER